MESRVSFHPLARLDLIDLHDFIADAAGAEVAARYIERLEKACRALASFPERGTLRESLGPGLRTIGFERRATIAFRVLLGEVQIVRVLYAGRDVEGILRGGSES